MKILTIKLLEELISKEEFSKIKMKTKIKCDGIKYTEDTKIFDDGNFKIERREKSINLEWRSYDGDPNIQVQNENSSIDYISDKCDDSYQYLLYID